MYITKAHPHKEYINGEIINKIIDKLNLNIEITKEEEQTLLTYNINDCWQNIENYFNIDITTNPLTNKCDYAQKILGKSLENIGLTIYPKETLKTISPKVIGHSFLIVKFPQNTYIVDPTYNQFLTKEGCNPNKFIIYNNQVLKTPDPGLFITQTNKGKNIAEDLITKGYIPLTEENAKIYCDSFYYTNQGTILINGKIPISNIDGSIYLNSLLKENHTYSTSDDRFNELYPTNYTI